MFFTLNVKQINKKEITYKKYFKDINNQRDYWLMLFNWNKKLAEKKYEQAEKWLDHEFEKIIASSGITEE
jgi:hypothetical protein